MLGTLAMADKYTKLFVGLAALWLLVIVLGAAIWYYRRRWWLSESQADAEPWTLADLRQLRDTGSMTAEEYEKIRAAMIGGLRAGPGNPDANVNSSDPPDASRKAGF